MPERDADVLRPRIPRRSRFRIAHVTGNGIAFFDTPSAFITLGWPDRVGSASGAVAGRGIPWPDRIRPVAEPRTHDDEDA